jgi:proline dehydrogenase
MPSVRGVRVVAGSGRSVVLSNARLAASRRPALRTTVLRTPVPCCADWYGCFTRRLASRPADAGFFLRSLATRS